MCCSHKSQTVFWFLCNTELVYFPSLCNVMFLTPSVFPTKANMSVSGVVITVEMQGLTATVILFKFSISLHMYQRWQVSKQFIGDVCATVAIFLPLQSCWPVQIHNSFF